MVFQSYALFPHMKARRQYRLRAEHPRRGRAARSTRRSSKAAGILNLLLLSRPLSPPAVGRPAPARRHGPRHRARSARCSCSTSRLSNLDAQSARADAHRDQGAAPAAEIDHRLCHARPDRGHDHGRPHRGDAAGRIEQVGAPLELYDRPANRFVAGFLGSPSMSFVSGALKQRPAKAWFETRRRRAPCACRQAGARRAARWRPASGPSISSSAAPTTRWRIKRRRRRADRLRNPCLWLRRQRHGARRVPRQAADQAGRPAAGHRRSRQHPSVRQGDGAAPVKTRV